MNLLYNPTIAKVLKELDFCYPAEGAIWLEQMSYWCRKEMGHLMRDGKRYIYNAYKQWTKEQITSLSPWQFGKMLRELKRLGWVATSNFANLKKLFIGEPPQEFHEYNTTTWVTLNEDAIERATGIKLLSSTDVATATKRNCQRKKGTLRSQQRSICKDYPNNTKSNASVDLKIEEDEDTISPVPVRVRVRDTEKTSLTTTNVFAKPHVLMDEPLTENLSLSGDEDIKGAIEFLQQLNERVRCEDSVLSPRRPPKISLQDKELETEVKQILETNSEKLQELNVDLEAEKIIDAIAANPQYLEDAIFALYESSAKGAKTPEMATGFFYNALCKGWKPRERHCANPKVPVYQPDPTWLNPPPPPTLEELIERKRLMWLNAPVMRPAIAKWVQETEGVTMEDIWR